MNHNVINPEELKKLLIEAYNLGFETPYNPDKNITKMMEKHGKYRIK
jgi:hypothetical protein